MNAFPIHELYTGLSLGQQEDRIGTEIEMASRAFYHLFSTPFLNSRFDPFFSSLPIFWMPRL